MAVVRQGNWIGQMRVDVPHLRALESAVANDFDNLAGKVWAGEQANVIRGFTIPTTSTYGNPASQLVLNVANGILFHFNATESGTTLVVDPARTTEALNSSNSRVDGTFVSSALNYVGLDYTRTADAATDDITKFLDPNTKLETERTVPQARILDYRIVISLTPFSFSPNICPIAQIETDAGGNIVSITDARQMLFRLGNGGDVPNPFGSYSWRDTSRRENDITYSVSSTDDPFSGGDKQIYSMKEWMDAVTSVLWDAKSGEYWYSPTNRDTMKVIYAPGPGALVSGDNFQWVLGTETLTWVNLFVMFENASGGYYNTITDGNYAAFAAGECIYVDVDRTTAATLTMQRALLTNLGAPVIPGSRIVIAYRLGNYIYVRDRSYEVARSFTVATQVTTPGSYGGGSGGVLGMVRLTHASSQPANPVVLSDGAIDAAYGVVGLDSQRKATIAAPTGGTYALQVTGPSGGYAIRGLGGASSGVGVYGQGGTTNGVGVYGLSVGSGAGVFGEATGTGPGVKGIGNTGTSGLGVVGLGGGGGSPGNQTPLNVNSGGLFTGTGSTAYGLEAYGGGTSGVGVKGQGGSSGTLGNTTPAQANSGGLFTGRGGAYGLEAYGGGSNGVGLFSSGNGTGAGGDFDGQGTGTGSSDDAIISRQNIHLSGTNPTSSQGYSNRVTPLNVAKAWGCVESSTTTDASVVDGFNITATSPGGAGIARIRVTFTTALSPPSADSYAVIHCRSDNNSGTTRVTTKTATYFEITFYDFAGAIANNTGLRVDFVVYGRQ